MIDGNKKRGLVVLGMHRSGTSCLAGMLQFAGFSAGMVSEWDPYNPKGNRENQAVLKLNQAILTDSGGSWSTPPESLVINPVNKDIRDKILVSLSSQDRIWMFKEPRTLITLPFWLESETRFDLIGIVRNPLAVAKSLSVRDKLTIPEGLRLWCIYNAKLLKAVQVHNAPLLCFTDNADSFLTAVKDAIGNMFSGKIASGNLDLEKIEAFYSKKLINQQYPDQIDLTHELARHAINPEEQARIQDLWGSLIACAVNPPEHETKASIDSASSATGADKLFSENQLPEIDIKEQRFKSQLKQLNSEISRSPSKSKLWHQGIELHNRFNKRARLVGWMKLWLNKYPDEPLLLFELAKVYWAIGLHKKAITKAEKCISLAPGWLAPLKQLEKWLLEAGFLDKSEKVSKMLLQYEGTAAPLEKAQHAQLFFDQGDGYSEEKSIKITILSSKENFTGVYTLPDPPKIKRLRLDPLNEPIVLRLTDSSYFDKNNKKHEARVSHSNAEFKQGSIYYFGNHDPQFHFKDFSKNRIKPYKFVISYEILKKGKDAKRACLDKLA